MNQTIKVKFDNGKVTAEPNPLGNVMPKDTVTWSFDPMKELQVLFLKVRELPSGLPQPCNPLGPFSSIKIDAGMIVGTIRSDVPTTPPNQRFLYKLFEKGNVLAWNNPLPGEAADGGIDIPMTPN